MVEPSDSGTGPAERSTTQRNPELVTLVDVRATGQCQLDQRGCPGPSPTQVDIGRQGRDLLRQQLGLRDRTVGGELDTGMRLNTGEPTYFSGVAVRVRRR